jgi:hypothetical protein
MAKGLYLPDMGTDWLEGCEDLYIVISLSRSLPELTMFWTANEWGYTSTLINAGRFPGLQIRAGIDKYNNGLSTVAVPLTRRALGLLGLYPLSIDHTVLDEFLTIEKIV